MRHLARWTGEAALRPKYRGDVRTVSRLGAGALTGPLVVRGVGVEPRQASRGPASLDLGMDPREVVDRDQRPLRPLRLPVRDGKRLAPFDGVQAKLLCPVRVVSVKRLVTGVHREQSPDGRRVRHHDAEDMTEHPPRVPGDNKSLPRGILDAQRLADRVRRSVPRPTADYRPRSAPRPATTRRIWLGIRGHEVTCAGERRASPCRRLRSMVIGRPPLRHAAPGPAGPGAPRSAWVLASRQS